MTAEQEQLVRNLDTAFSWSAGSGEGLQLYALASTRQVQSEEHRALLLREIDANLAWNREPERLAQADEVNDPARDIPRLEALRAMVQTAPVGHELLSHGEYGRLHEELYAAGKLR